MFPETTKDFKTQSTLLFWGKSMAVSMRGKFVSLIGNLALIAGCSFTGSGSSFHKVVQLMKTQ